MDIIIAIILGALQGLLEWLPISSEGQTMLFTINFLGLTPTTALSLALWLHLGTTGTVLIYFRRDFVSLFNSPINKHLWSLLILSFIGTGLTGIPIWMLLQSLFTVFYAGIVSIFIGIMLILTAVILKRSKTTGDFKSFKNMSYQEMLLLGIVQGFAILPGISRSGLTVSFLLIFKFTQTDALKNSYLVSIPAVIGSILFDTLFNADEISLLIDPFLISIFILTAMIIGLISMHALLKIANRLDFSSFCLFLGMLIILIETIGITLTF